MKQTTAVMQTLDQRSMQGESGLWIFLELLAYDKDLLTVKQRTASLALGQGEQIYHKTYTVEFQPWI
jgi:hypothetical protein